MIEIQFSQSEQRAINEIKNNNLNEKNLLIGIIVVFATFIILNLLDKKENNLDALIPLLFGLLFYFYWRIKLLTEIIKKLTSK